MTRVRRPALILGIIALSGLLFAGCKATGGGTLPPGTVYDDNAQTYQPTGGKKATFGFVWKTESPESSLVSGSWSDGFVKFKFEGGYIDTDTDGQDGCGESEYATYTSTNKAYPGSGAVHIYLCDEGEPGPTSGDGLEIEINSGPYEGYTNAGELTGGNFQIKQ